MGFTAHPSFITPEELEAIQGPLSIAAAGESPCMNEILRASHSDNWQIETDPVFTTEQRHASEDILKKAGVPYQLNLFSGVEHSFAVRADLSKKWQVFAKEQVFEQAAAWFKYHL